MDYISPENYEKLQSLMRNIFELGPDTEIEELEQDECENWTSARHLSLVMEMESCFGVKFKIDEVVQMRSFPEIVQTLQGKL